MKKYIWLALGILMAMPVMAQQIPLYSQYNLNPFLYNPARTGQQGGLNVNLIYRRMWTDIPGAPETRAISLDGAIVDDKVGLGAFVYQDFTNIVNRNAGYLSYAYFFKLKPDMRLSLGINAGVVQTRINFDEASFGDGVIDPVQSNNTQSGVAFDASAGINYQWKGLNVGFAVPQLFKTRVKYLSDDDETGYQLARHYLVNASYEIPIKKDLFFIEPIAMFRAAEGKTYQFDIGSSFMFKRIAWISAMYRFDYAVTVSAGVRVHNRFNIGYAYDINTNNLKGNGGGTHEVMVGLRFGKKEDKGLVESIKKLEESQQLQNERINTLEQKVDSVGKGNDQLRNELQQKDAKIQQLENQVQQIIQDIAKRDSAQTGSSAPIPSDLVYKGKKEDLEFIKGKPDGNYFMVVSSVRTETLARKIADGLEAKGHKIGIVYNKRRTWYYLYLTQPGNLEEGIKELYKIRRETEFKDAWIHIYE
ncbi:MAG: PorP/SprF family type IX secretion system membrane protein [Chitinophagales bacterium]|nr:PorP/SprF family type IX secretion system membrane protein [Chitinophagales bacterium]